MQLGVSLLWLCSLLKACATLPDNYDEIWESTSQNSGESMPCGGGDVGLNVWAEGGDVLFYIARSGTFDENGLFPKLGRIRITLSPNPLTQYDAFEQRLCLDQGYIKITARQGEISAQFIIWVDVHAPVIHVDINSTIETTVVAQFENWRYEDRVMSLGEQGGTDYKTLSSVRALTYKDEVNFHRDGILFYHRNRGNTSFDYDVTQQDLGAVKESIWNPAENVTYGGWMKGSHMKPGSTKHGIYANASYKAWQLRSEMPQKDHRIQIALHQNQSETLGLWQSELQYIIGINFNKLAHVTRDWWRRYWERSYIYINLQSRKSESAWQVGRNYQLFRYMLGCNAYGSQPTKFNGGLFTYDPYNVDTNCPYAPDYRRWGGSIFTAQNQRLVYWPMLKSGDIDMMQAQFSFYLHLLATAKVRSLHYFGVEGAYFSEQINHYGLENPFDWVSTAAIYNKFPPPDWPNGVEWNDWLTYSWDTILEFDYMILEARRFGEIDITQFLPLIESSLKFFDNYYQKQQKERSTKALDMYGHLVLFPGSAAETYKGTYNSATTISGLLTVLQEVLKLPDTYLQLIDTTYFENLLTRIPPLPLREFSNHTTLAPAAAYDRIQNVEMPQLYPVYPYGIYGLGKPNLSIAIDTYLHDMEIQPFKSHIGWKQDNIFCARLGLIEEAKKYTTLKMQDSGRRFPAFWGPGFDWAPDHNWGGSGMIGLQEMLLQTDGRSITILPAWPKDWTAKFKLWAPFNTSVEGIVHGGILDNLVVTPASRLKDVRIV